MKKHQLKSYLKLGILLFGILIFFFACKQDDIENQNEEQKNKYLLGKIEANEFEQNFKLKEKISELKTKNKSSGYQARYENETFELDLNQATYIESEDGSYHSYTFYIYNDEGNSNINNIVLSLNEDGTYDADLVTYTLTEQERNQINNGIEIDLLDKMTIEPFEINQINTYSRSGTCTELVAVGTSCPCMCFYVGSGACTDPETVYEWQSVDCGGSGGSSGGTGSGSNGSGFDGSSGGASNSGSGTSLPPKATSLTTTNGEDEDCNTSKKDLKKIFPNASDSDRSTLAHVINNKGEDFGINTKEKLQHFLSQAGHEVGGFNNGIGIQESLHYTTANRLKSVYKKYFKQNAADTTGTKRDADSTYLQNSSKVANYVYCCRMGNGNEASGDGYKYRGRGIFQLTGKTNYTNFKTWYNNKYDPDKDFVSSPEMLKNNDTIAILSALWYYKTSVLDKITIDSTTSVKIVTKKVNGGRNGLADRKEIYTKAKDSITCL